MKSIWLFLPALAQVLILLWGQDFYPFSNNEMYAGPTSASDIEVLRYYGMHGEKTMASRSDFLEEVYSSLIEAELQKTEPQWESVCALLWKDRKPRVAIDRIRIERQTWSQVTSLNTQTPDTRDVLHECLYN